MHATDLKRILLVRNDGIGDVVLTLPAFAALRAHFPRAHLTAFVSRPAAPLVAVSRLVDEILVDEPAENAGELGRRLKPAGFDAALVFNTNTRNCLAVWRSGIRQRVFWAYKPIGFLLGNRRVAVHRSRPPIHESEFALAFVRRLGVAAKLADFLPRLEIDAATQARVAARIARELGTGGPLFGVHPGNKNSAYNWPEWRYAELICRLGEHGRVMVTGTRDEQPLLERLRAQLTDAARRRVGFFCDLELSELVAAISQQTALTVSSTGPMHLAGVVGTPIVALFSPHPAHSPKKWAPLGAPHTLLIAPLAAGEDPRVPRDKAAGVMARIAVDHVVDANLNYARGGVAGGKRNAVAPGSSMQAA